MNKQDWTYKKLGEVCDIICGQDYKKVESPDGKYPIYGTGGIMGFANQFRCPAYSVIIGRKGSINNPLYVEEDFWNVDTAFGIVPSKANLLSKYFFYFCKSYDFTKHNVAVTIPSLRRIDLLKILIPVPPLAEQERIVAELDLLSGIIEKKKEQLKAYDQLAQSIFYTMFGDPIDNPKGWETKKLSENVHEMFLGPFGSALKVDSYVPKEESYCMVYEQKHAIQATINLDNHFINKEKFESLQRFEVKPHDFIMSCRGTIGRLYQLPENAPKGIIHPSLMKIRIKEEFYNSAFFQFLLVKIVANESTNGNCVQMAITAKELGKKELPVPPLSLQQEFAEKIEAIERQKALVQQSIEETQTMFDCTMDKYFG